MLILELVLALLELVLVILVRMPVRNTSRKCTGPPPCLLWVCCRWAFCVALAATCRVQTVFVATRIFNQFAGIARRRTRMFTHVRIFILSPGAGGMSPSSHQSVRPSQ